MSTTLDILCATDDCFAPYCGIMLTSLFENNKNKLCRVFIIVSQQLSRKNNHRLIKLGETYGQEIQFIKIDDSLFHGFPLLYGSSVTYFRLLGAELLPMTVSRVLYLDSDLIVNGDLSSLWSIDLSNAAVAVVTDRAPLVESRPNELQYPLAAGYFNAGVLLVNIDYWRANKISRQCISYLEKHHNVLRYHDQDVLNVVLFDKKIMLPLEYNFQKDFLRNDSYKYECAEFQATILKTSAKPTVIHYSGKLKPWSVAYYGNPYYKVWKSYKRLSLWARVPSTYPKRKKLNWFLKRFVLWPLGGFPPNSNYLETY